MCSWPYNQGNPYNRVTEYQDWKRRELKIKNDIREYEKQQKAKVKAKYDKYKEIRQQWHDKVIDWNTYCRLSKKYYQDPFTLSVMGIK